MSGITTPPFSSISVRNSFVLRSMDREQAPELKDVVARLLSFGDVLKLDFQHWRELGIVTAGYFDTRYAEKAYEHYYMLGEQAWEVLWADNQDQEDYCVRVLAEALAVVDPSQYGDMANISSPPGDACGFELTLLIQFFDSRAAKAMKAAQKATSPSPLLSEPGSVSTVSSAAFGGEELTLSALVADSIPRMPTLPRISSTPVPSIVVRPPTVDDFSVDVVNCWQDPRTTIMVKNIPNKLTQQRMLQMIDEVSEGTYNFFYLPIDLRNRCNVGYAFINFVEPAHIVPFYQAFHGAGWKSFNNSSKICDLSYARIQGKQALMKHFTAATLPKNPAMRPLFRTGNSLQPLGSNGDAVRYTSCVVDSKPSLSAGGLLPEPTRARTLPTGRLLR